MEVIQRALEEGRNVLSEYESKQVLAAYGIPVAREVYVEDSADFKEALRRIGFPVVLKGCSPQLAHKTERDVIRVDLRDEEEAEAAFRDIRSNMGTVAGGILVQEMVRGKRELVVGMTRDPQFGPCVMFGLGGIFTEILKDVSFRLAPLDKRDALEMMREIRSHKILDAVRGMDAADVEALSDVLIRVGRIGVEEERIKEIDINPVILSQGKPLGVDALILLQ